MKDSGARELLTANRAAIVHDASSIHAYVRKNFYLKAPNISIGACYLHRDKLKWPLFELGLNIKLSNSYSPSKYLSGKYCVNCTVFNLKLLL